ncbi:MAG: SDR family NAD(P)-dependent oxidoreductase, partial [Thermoanaerobaculia bacterium]
GSAINNDGGDKVGYTAPSVEGQARVIRAALLQAEVDAATIGYVEAHGTATPLGDPIEIAALKRAFPATDSATCALGSIKSNFGHLDAAAGVAGFIKTVLALEHRAIPASLHFERPNPRLELADTPFFVNSELRDWTAGDAPRRAGVSSFGIGGTNAHVVLEEAPAATPGGPSRPWQLLVLSAKTPTALERAAADLARHLEAHPDEPELADVAHTLQRGRRVLPCRGMVVARDAPEAAAALTSGDPRRFPTRVQEPGRRPVAFLFPGQGVQYSGMGRRLYEGEPTFRAELDRCAELLEPDLGLDLRRLLFPALENRAEAARRLTETALTQPALFAVELALARQWMEWGVRPEAMVGHSIGEYVAACVAEVISVPDALALVAERGRLIASLPAGVMLAVGLPADELASLLAEFFNVAVAAVNAPRLTVVSGPAPEVADLEQRLGQQHPEIETRRLHTSHAFHGPMMDPILDRFRQRVESVELRAPRIPYLSNLTGTWIEPGQATDPRYWVDHLRSTVQFADAVGELLREPARLFLEVGPGRTLGTLMRQHPAWSAERVAVASLRGPKDRGAAGSAPFEALGRLWLAGADVDWQGFYAHERRRRVELPCYPFERQRYWIDPGNRQATGRRDAGAPSCGRRQKIAEWFYQPVWKQAPRPATVGADRRSELGDRWLVFSDGSELAASLVERLAAAGHEVVTVAPAGDRRLRADHVVDPGRRRDYQRLLAALRSSGVPRRIVHSWTLGEVDADLVDERAFWSPLWLAQALAAELAGEEVELLAVTRGLAAVTGDEELVPEHAQLLGLFRALPHEFPRWRCRLVDATGEKTGERLFAELTAGADDPVVALRGRRRFVEHLEPLSVAGGAGQDLFRDGGVYLVTGGLGGIGLALAERLARSVASPRLVLAGRSGLPPRDQWTSLAEAEATPDSLRRRIRRVRELEALGAEVMVAAADVCRPDEMAAVLAEARERYGGVDGVVHAAGVAGGGLIELEDGEAAARVLAPKVEGTRVLARVLADDPPDFVVLCSSLAALLGGAGQAAYCAANAFLDASAQHNANLRDDGGEVPFTLALDWDTWSEVGMAAEAEIPRGREAEWRRQLDNGIRPREGMEVFDRALSTGLAQLAISTREPGADSDAGELAAAPESPATHQRPELATPYAAPELASERALAGFWCELLGLDRVGVSDDFFELGGHSLLATQLMSRIRERFGVDLALRTIFDAPTVRELAAVVESSASPESLAAVGEELPLVAAGDDGEPPLSFAQERLWFFHQLEPSSPAYNMPGAFHLRGELDVGALRSLDEVVRRHGVLRATFPADEDGRARQTIVPRLTGILERVDLSSLSPQARSRESRRLVAEDAGRPFDLARGPLIRSLLVILEPRQHLLLLTVHHIVSDFWSMGVFFRELTAIYAAFAGGHSASLPEPTLQYADFARWQRRNLSGERLESLLDYWRQQLGGALPVLELPFDRPRPAFQTTRGGRRSFA